MIKLSNISKKYGNNLVLDNINYTFPEKGLVCIVGESGCGKTTLLNMLAGFDTEYQGDITVEGVPLNTLTSEELCQYRRDKIGFVFQNYNLLTGYSTLENVLLSEQRDSNDNGEALDKAKTLLSKLSIEDKKDQLCETLSGGQKQRVAIARALLGSPSILLCDEPTGALDRKTSTEIMEMLKEISLERLVVVITHDPKILTFADEVINLKDKQLEVEKSGEFKESNKLKEPKKQFKSTRVKSLKIARKNFKVNIKKYITVATAISIGVIAILLSLSSGKVIEQSVSEFKEKNTAYNNGYIKGNDEKTFKMLSEDKRIENVYYQCKLNNITLEINSKDILIEEKIPMPKSTEVLSYGVLPRKGKNEMSITPSLAKKFSSEINTLIGKEAKLKVDGKEYILKISGIYNAAYDDFFVSSDIEKQMYKDSIKETYSISYDVTDFKDIVEVSNMLKEKGIDSKNAAKEVLSMENTFKSLEKIFLVVAILISGISLFVCIVLLVKLQSTRYREVGLLSALGFEKADIKNILIKENLILGGLSSIISSVILIIVIVVLKLMALSFNVGIGQFLLCNIGVFITIVIISYLTSLRLINIDPAIALRK
ncbi:MAG: ABC transporter ATP-binding protein/permease [Clostridium sp.]|uniref:ABC transporter ATP-binding protein/permease n=1 Tax=Clostridium sp. TaxID=1506 RepID=UPI002FC75700